jgi:hypothetical protein
VVDHGCDDQVDVDPEGVVEHEPYEGQDSEDVAHRQACWQLHFHEKTENIFLITEFCLICG